MHTKLLPMLAAIALLAGCRQADDAQTPAMAYRQACPADNTVKCQAMRMDIQIARLETVMKAVRQSEDRQVACQGRPAYDAGMALMDEKLGFYRKLKPNVFMRSVLSDMQIDFKPRPFKQEAQLAAFVASLDQCQKGMAALVSGV